MNVSYATNSTYKSGTYNTDIDKNLSFAYNTAITPNTEIDDSAKKSTEESPAFTVAISKKNEEKKDSSLRTSDGRKPTVSEESQLKQEVAEYAQDDRHVRSHEAAHMAAGGQFAGAASFSYKKGPDGKMYAVSGEVPLDMSEDSDPKKTLIKAQQLQRAALAPADPSPQDLSVASGAAAIAQKASADIRQETLKQSSSDDKTKPTADNNTSTLFSVYKNKNNTPNSPLGQTVDIAA